PHRRGSDRLPFGSPNDEVEHADEQEEGVTPSESERGSGDERGPRPPVPEEDRSPDGDEQHHGDEPGVIEHSVGERPRIRCQCHRRAEQSAQEQDDADEDAARYPHALRELPRPCGAGTGGATLTDGTTTGDGTGYGGAGDGGPAAAVGERSGMIRHR